MALASTADELAYKSLHPMAKLYGWWAFHFMIDVATALAHDFVERAHHYRGVPSDISDLLTALRTQSGAHPDWPDRQQRIALFRPLGTACQAAIPLREAAVTYVENATQLNQGTLLDAFADASACFRNQIRSMEGQALDTACRQVGRVFESSLRVFRSGEAMQVFHLQPAPINESWPLLGHRTGEGAALATELILALDAGIDARALLGGPMREIPGAPAPKPLAISMSPTKFTLLQQTAWYGAMAICTAMADVTKPEDLLPAVGHAYKWARALQKLVPDIVRVWKDPNYRTRLTDLEWGMVEPHPSGVMNASLSANAAPMLGYSTATVRGEVCCSTGDLPCAPTSNCHISPNPSCLNCGSIAVIGCIIYPF